MARSTAFNTIVAANITGEAAHRRATLIGEVHRALASLGRSTQVEEPLMPAVAIRRSVQPDHVVCLECGYHSAAKCYCGFYPGGLLYQGTPASFRLKTARSTISRERKPRTGSIGKFRSRHLSRQQASRAFRKHLVILLQPRNGSIDKF